MRHSRKDEWVIEASLEGLVIHARLIEEFEKLGFTGYRLKPATVRFRDGYLSGEYSELVVTGWAGVAPPESGIELTEACGGCGYKHYTSLKNPEHLIDWSQWTGDDFFIVWPLPRYVLITKRVADALAGLQVKSYRLKSLSVLAGPFLGRPGIWCRGAFLIPSRRFGSAIWKAARAGMRTRLLAGIVRKAPSETWFPLHAA